MRALFILLALALLSGCVLVQDAYDSENLKQCRALPTPDERLQCERDAHDASSDRRYNDDRGMVQKGCYVLPKDLCPAEDEHTCDFD
ncbi:MAG: hypothetical protein L3J02_03490 [Henriciella sp.]|nr:hypothetical protein [Henriciella sp.]